MNPLMRPITSGSPAKRRIALLAVLSLLAIFIAVRRSADIAPSAAHARHSAAARHHDAATNELRAPKVPATIATIAWPEEPVRDLFRWTNEPTKAPPPTVDAAAIEQLARTRLELQGIVLGDSPRAILNGRARGIGDEISGFRLFAIESRHVIVQRDGVSVTVALKRSSSDQPTGPE